MRPLLIAAALLASVPASAGQQPGAGRLDGALARASEDSRLPAWVGLVATEPVEAGGPRFRATTVTIDGSKAALVFGDLELLPDGTYRLGAERGGYRADQAGLKLEGAAAQWGRGAYSSDADEISFRFFRGRFLYQVTFRRAPQR